jgi:hypothetical protein
MKVGIHLFLTSGPDRGEWSAPRSGGFTLRKEHWYPWSRRLGGTHSRPAKFWRRERSLYITGIRTQNRQACKKSLCVLPNSQFESEPGYESIVTEVLRDFLQLLQENVMHTPQFPVRIWTWIREYSDRGFTWFSSVASGKCQDFAWTTPRLLPLEPVRILPQYPPHCRRYNPWE